MPLYDYRCHSCGRTFELLRRMKDTDRDLHYPDCQSNKVERLLSPFSSMTCRPPAGSRFR